MSIDRRHVGQRMSQIVIHGGTVYLAGQVATENAGQPADAQTREILEKIDGYLAEAGSDKTKILRATIWLADIGDYDAMNGVWDAWVPEHHAPARACVEAKLAGPEYTVEISVIAALI